MVSLTDQTMMKDVDISRALDEDVKKENQEQFRDLADEEASSNFGVKEDSRSIVVMVLAIVGIFVLALGGFKIYGSLTSAGVVDIDQMHQDNLDGKLDEEGYVYNGFSFVKVDGLWWTEVNRLGTLVKVPLHFGPKELEDIEMTGELSSDFNKGNDVYISIDPAAVGGHYVIAMREISANVGQGINRNSVGACTKEHEGCEDRKILNCENTQGLPVIELEVSEEQSIELSGTCITVKGTGYGIIKAANRLLYQWYDIME